MIQPLTEEAYEFPSIDLDVFQLEGKLCTTDLVYRIAALHRRRGHINNLKKEQDDILSELQPDSNQRRIHAKLVNDIIGELSTIKSRLTEYSLLLRYCYDQILIDKLREKHRKVYDQLMQEAEVIYLIKHKKSHENKNQKNRG